jgi:ParB family chromosome partitioning protein
MTRRRIFDIDLPAEAAPEPAAPVSSRRGPMATAIGENAESLRRRQEAEAAIRAENDRLAHEFVRLKRLGLITDLIPVSEVRTSKLIRDRSRRRDDEMDELKASIREIGLSNPIRVEQVPGGYELVQGYRRLTAYRELLEETGDPAFATIPAGILAAGETMDGLYRRMVDENLVRRDLSFWEMAAFARACAEDPDSGAGDVDTAVASLFRSANRQKRVYIRHFATLVGALEKVLNWPEAIPRALGLALVRRFEDDPALPAAIAAALRSAAPRSAEEELAILRRHADDSPPAPPSPRGQPAVAPAGAAQARKGKTTFRLVRPQGEARCTAAAGRVELRMDRDFSAIERRRLEEAVAAFFRALDG